MNLSISKSIQSFRRKNLLGKTIENRVDTIFIHVTNLKKSVMWYSKLLG